MTPYRLDVRGEMSVSPACFPERARRHESLGVPLLKGVSAPHSRPLAVVGGGPGVRDRLDELRAWEGDIWAINGTCQWLASQGIDSVFFTVDPNPPIIALAEGVKRAIVSSGIDPEAMDALLRQGTDVRMFHTHLVEDADDPVETGATSAVSSMPVAFRLGYCRLVLFGCESSYARATHAFKDEAPEEYIVVRAGGKHYRTSIQFYDQAIALHELILIAPLFFPDRTVEERSGGLLAAMVANPESWEVAGFSKALRDQLDPTSTDFREVEAA